MELYNLQFHLPRYWACDRMQAWIITRTPPIFNYIKGWIKGSIDEKVRSYLKSKNESHACLLDTRVKIRARLFVGRKDQWGAAWGQLRGAMEVDNFNTLSGLCKGEAVGERPWRNDHRRMSNRIRGSRTHCWNDMIWNCNSGEKYLKPPKEKNDIVAQPKGQIGPEE